MKSIATNKMAAVWLLLVGISMMSSQGLVGVSQDHPPGRTVPQLLLTSVRVEISIPFIPKVGEVFEATLTIYCKNDLEPDRLGRPGPDYKVTFEGDVEFINGREHIIYDYLKQGETKRFKAKMVIKKAKERVGIGGGIVTTKRPYFAQGANIEMFLVDPQTGQYGTKEEYEGKLPVEHRYDPVDGSFTCSPDRNPAPVEENRRIIKMIRDLEPRLSDSLALLFHSDQYRVGVPKGLPKWDEENKRWLEEEIFEYYLKDGWFESLHAGKREAWIIQEREKIMKEVDKHKLNFFRDNNSSNSDYLGSNNPPKDRITTTFIGQIC